MTANKNDPDFKEKVANAAWSWASTAPIQYTDHLPESFKELPNGHMATHKLLIDDFCRAAYENKLPVVDAWTAARYTIPGIVAVESAYQGGVLMDVPDLGDSPAGWDRSMITENIKSSEAIRCSLFLYDYQVISMTMGSRGNSSAGIWVML